MSEISILNGYKIKDKKAVRYYDTISNMKSDTTLKAGMYVKTKGYYSVNDGGNAEYYIRTKTNEDIEDNGRIHFIDNLVAELLIDNSVSVKQFGAKGDGENDDTTAFNNAMSKSKYVIIPSGIYKIAKFQSVTGVIVKGINKPTINLTGINVNAPLVDFVDNIEIDNISFNCTVEDLANNRSNIQNHSNITITNCEFKGFRHNNPQPNAWGILIGANASNIKIENCYFDNNSQSDIAIVEDVDNVVISECRGSAFNINIEPNNGNPIKNININTCDIDNIDIQENFYLKTSLQNMVISNSTINTVHYDGGTARFINCKVGNYDWKPAENIAYAGILDIKNSAVFSKNLIDDPYLDTFTSNGSEWLIHYNPITFIAGFSGVNDNDGISLCINPENTSTAIYIKSKKINVIEDNTYLLRINSKCKIPENGGNHISLNARLYFFNNNDEEVSSYKISLNRQENNTISSMSELSTIFKVPEGATKVEIRFLNSEYGTQSFYVRSVELYEIKGNQGTNSNNIESLPVRTKREFNSTAIPTGNTVPYSVGDKLTYKTPSTYIGAVCTVASSNGNAGTWKNYGALES